MVYALGYVRRDREHGKGRNTGNAYLLAEFGLTVLGGLTGYQMVMGN